MHLCLSLFTPQFIFGTFEASFLPWKLTLAPVVESFNPLLPLPLGSEVTGDAAGVIDPGVVFLCLSPGGFLFRLDVPSPLFQLKAIRRTGAPLPPSIFIGRPITMAPTDGSRSRLATNSIVTTRDAANRCWTGCSRWFCPESTEGLKPKITSQKSPENVLWKQINALWVSIFWTLCLEGAFTLDITFWMNRQRINLAHRRTLLRKKISGTAVTERYRVLRDKIFLCSKPGSAFAPRKVRVDFISCGY